MRFMGAHGVLPEEQRTPQAFEVDAELHLDLRRAGRTDDLEMTADYRLVFDICRETVEGPSFRLIESIAETIATRLLRAFEALAVEGVVVRVRKPDVALPGKLDFSSVEIRRTLADLS
jgi:dihydroneopterin aldolase